jgi:hypothetical protein
MAKQGFSRAFLPITCGLELLFSASFFSCCFEMAKEGFLRAFVEGRFSSTKRTCFSRALNYD